jgi:glycosyltransferase involved in cell wall biosynthesis
MIENTLKGRYRDAEISIVPMAFSRQLRGLGRPSLRKVLHLFFLIIRIAVARVRTGARVLYYSPAGPERAPMYRDLALLLSTRWMFEKTILHFHAGGVSELYPKLGPTAQALFRRAYFGADVGIRLSAQSPDDPGRLEALSEFIVPNGVEDAAGRLEASDLATREGAIPILLFAGMLRESKGIFVLLEACAELRLRGIPFSLALVGEYHSADDEARLRSLVQQHDLDSAVHHRGMLVGEEKRRAFLDASVFCFPSFYESESFPLVLIEAMQFSLPIVTTPWRGIPALVAEGVNGYLVPVKDSRALADRIALLLADRGLAHRLGDHGRQTFEACYTIDHFHARLQQVFDAISEGLPA